MNKKFAIIAVLMTVLAVNTFAPLPAFSATIGDIKVAARTFKFAGVPKGALEVAIIYNDASKAEAESINGAFGGGLKAGKNKLTGKLVHVSDLSGVAGSKVAIITDGLSESEWLSIQKAAGAAGALTVTSDKACVDAKKCVMAVRAKPSVEINVSQSTADASGIKLKAALKLMVKMQD